MKIKIIIAFILATMVSFAAECTASTCDSHKYYIKEKNYGHLGSSPSIPVPGQFFQWKTPYWQVLFEKGFTLKSKNGHTSSDFKKFEFQKCFCDGSKTKFYIRTWTYEGFGIGSTHSYYFHETVDNLDDPIDVVVLNAYWSKADEIVQESQACDDGYQALKFENKKTPWSIREMTLTVSAIDHVAQKNGTVTEEAKFNYVYPSSDESSKIGCFKFISVKEKHSNEQLQTPHELSRNGAKVLEKEREEKLNRP